MFWWHPTIGLKRTGVSTRFIFPPVDMARSTRRSVCHNDEELRRALGVLRNRIEECGYECEEAERALPPLGVCADEREACANEALEILEDAQESIEDAWGRFLGPIQQKFHLEEEEEAHWLEELQNLTRKIDLLFLDATQIQQDASFEIHLEELDGVARDIRDSQRRLTETTTRFRSGVARGIASREEYEDECASIRDHLVMCYAYLTDLTEKVAPFE